MRVLGIDSLAIGSSGDRVWVWRGASAGTKKSEKRRKGVQVSGRKHYAVHSVLKCRGDMDRSLGILQI
nr:hypothetical protein [Tanacetum cinerariifolium]